MSAITSIHNAKIFSQLMSVRCTLASYGFELLPSSLTYDACFAGVMSRSLIEIAAGDLVSCNLSSVCANFCGISV